MPFDFDRVIDRRASDSGKWNRYPADVLPLWVADMDFAVPDAIVSALRARVEHGVFGYGSEPETLKRTIVERMHRLYGWEILPEDVVMLPGLVSGLNAVASAVGAPGSSILADTPVYGPFLTAPLNQGRTLSTAEQPVKVQADGTLYYESDIDALEAAVRGDTGLMYLCSPHNPTGRAWSPGELARFAGLAERHDLVLCSDEIHCDLLHDGVGHVPVASLAPEIANRTITLMAPSKTFNVPGLGAAFAIVQNKTLRGQLEKAMAGIVPHTNILGVVAAQAAFTGGDEWLQELRAYLTANRDFVVDFVRDNLHGVRTTRPEATYLAWFDCRETGIEGSPSAFFLEHAKVAVNEGTFFGDAGKGFVRLNFGCRRSVLQEGLERMAEALARINR